jgi:hypothetical protein
MTDSLCGYPGDRDEALVTYLYDEGAADAAARAMFEAHLTTCVRCSEDLVALRGVRTQLARWSPPEPKFAGAALPANPESGIPTPVSWWREIPAWAQVAAALLFLGVSAGIANLDVRYDDSGLSVRTGWLPPARVARFGEPGTTPAVAAARSASPAATERASLASATQGSGSAPWRADLAALERQLKTEFHAGQSGVPTAVSAQSARAAADAEIVRRVRALIDESEKRQQRELALRVAEVIRDVNAQRQADLVRVDRALGTVQNNLGGEIMKQRQSVNLLYRASQRQ